LIGHVSRDATAIEARERPRPKVDRNEHQERRECPQRSIRRQRGQTMAEMLHEIPAACDWGVKKNAKGRKTSWRGYKKLHLDTADCGIPISALLSSASPHDSMAAIPLSRMSGARVSNLYDVMDAGDCSLELREHCRQMGHAPLIEHNPRGGEKIEFEPTDAMRCHERAVAERMNARLKDEFGGRHVWVKGCLKAKKFLSLKPDFVPSNRYAATLPVYMFNGATIGLINLPLLWFLFNVRRSEYCFLCFPEPYHF
jgi:hypothetical protein